MTDASSARSAAISSLSIPQELLPADGRFGEIENYAQWCECADTAQDRAFLRRLNDERNAPMAERIEALHGEGKRVLVAVGALHMTGEQGLPRLMAARGFTVERLVPP